MAGEEIVSLRSPWMEGKMAKKVGEGIKELTNLAVATAVLEAVFPDMVLHSRDRIQTAPEDFEITVSLRDESDTKRKSARVLIKWPEGQEGHGVAEVVSEQIVPEVSGSVFQRKFVCWKNKNGKVEITEWSEPSDSLVSVVNNWQKYGVRMPHNNTKWFREASSFYHTILVTPALFILLGFILETTFELGARGVISIGSLFVFCFTWGYFLKSLRDTEEEKICTSFWNAEEKRMKELTAKVAKRAVNTGESQ